MNMPRRCQPGKWDWKERRAKVVLGKIEVIFFLLEGMDEGHLRPGSWEKDLGQQCAAAASLLLGNSGPEPGRGRGRRRRSRY